MIIITGASRGIGKYLIEKYWAKGETAYGIYKSNQQEQEPEKKEFLMQTDITDYSAIEKEIKKIRYPLKNITLINCAGVNYNSFAHKSDTELWAKVIQVNLIGTYNMIRAILPFMREDGFGRIINLSSVVSQTGVPGTSAYAASKAGLSGLIKSIALENAKKGITINNINLGYFNIGMIKEIPQEYLNMIKDKIPTGELGNPQNIFNAVQFIREADYMNGSSMDLNGGIF